MSQRNEEENYLPEKNTLKPMAHHWLKLKINQCKKEQNCMRQSPRKYIYTAQLYSIPQQKTFTPEPQEPNRAHMNQSVNISLALRPLSKLGLSVSLSILSEY